MSFSTESSFQELTHRQAVRQDRVGAAGIRLCTQQLFGKQRMIELDHGGVVYRLQITQTGKLILTK